MLSSVEVTTIVFGLSFLVMLWYLTNKGRENIEKARSEATPAIAGEDFIDGVAKNPEQFDEPDEDALQEMAKFLGEDE